MHQQFSSSIPTGACHPIKKERLLRSEDTCLIEKYPAILQDKRGLEKDHSHTMLENTGINCQTSLDVQKGLINLNPS